MLDHKPPATLEKQIALMGAVALLIGVIIVIFTGLVALGCVIVAYGLMALLLAVLFARAPYSEEPPCFGARVERCAHDR
jgi:hypothetical protein